MSQHDDIYDTYLNTRKHIAVSAGPGTGKTTCLLGICERTPKHSNVLLSSFSNKIVNELKHRAPEHIRASTMHSLCFSVLRQNIKINAKLNENKNFIYGKKIFPKEQNSHVGIISDIVGLMKMNLIDPASTEMVYALGDTYGYNIGSKEMQDIRKLYSFISKIDYSSHKEMFDFTDMLYLTWKLVPENKFYKYDVMAIDESQDLNRLQVTLLDRFTKRNTRKIFVGDEKQAIFAFQGADKDNFEKIKEMPNTVNMPLSVSYRCPKSHIELAKKYFPNIEAHENNIDGIIRDGNILEAKSGDIIICRNNLPLFKAFIVLLKNNKKCSIVGSDIHKNLLNLLNKAKTSSFESILEKKIESLEERGIKKPSMHPSFTELDERVQIAKMLISEFGGISEAIRTLEGIFRSEESGIELMTIHKAKGLEAERVFWLNRELLFKNVQTQLDSYSEKCVGFVASTRSKKELIFCSI